MKILAAQAHERRQVEDAKTDQQDFKFRFKRTLMISARYLDKAGIQARELEMRGGPEQILGVGKALGRGKAIMAAAISSLEPMPEASRTPGILEEWTSHGPIHLDRMLSSVWTPLCSRPSLVSPKRTNSTDAKVETNGRRLSATTWCPAIP